MDEKDFKIQIKRKYPYAYELMQRSGNDMLGWIFRNFIKR